MHLIVYTVAILSETQTFKNKKKKNIQNIVYQQVHLDGILPPTHCTYRSLKSLEPWSARHLRLAIVVGLIRVVVVPCRRSKKKHVRAVVMIPQYRTIATTDVEKSWKQGSHILAARQEVLRPRRRRRWSPLPLRMLVMLLYHCSYARS